MTSDVLNRECRYEAVTYQVKRMLSVGLITEQEFNEIEARFRAKYKPISGGYIVQTDLLCARRRVMNGCGKGCALLQKHYTADYLTKKIIRNDGAVPQYYVEDCHEAIIEPETFDRVQEMIEQRSRVRHFSGATIFSTKIRCGECGGWFGSKVWHSTDQYRRVIWRCNAKYGGKAAGCKTPHVTEEEVKAAFVRVVNKLIGNRAMLLADLREIQETYSGTDELSQRLHELDDRLNAEAEAVQQLIAQNARVAQNQDDYNAAYDAAVSRYEAIKAEREKVAADIRQRGIRRREFERFIAELKKMPEAVSEFDETLWGSLVDYVTVGKDKTMVFTLLGGTEMTA